MTNELISTLSKLADQYANEQIKNDNTKDWQTVRDSRFAELVYENTRHVAVEAMLAYAIWSPQKWELETDWINTPDASAFYVRIGFHLWDMVMNYDDLLWKCQGILEPKDYMRLAGLIVAEKELRYTNEQLKEKNDELYQDKERWYRMSERFCNKLEEMKKNEVL